METLAIILGLGACLSVTADMLNTLVATNTNMSRFWLTSILYRRTWRTLRIVYRLLPEDDPDAEREGRRHSLRERLLGFFAPVSVILLLSAWVVQQVIGFGLIWWGMGGVDGADSLFESIYYSGVIYFTLGFGEIVPSEAVPRIGALFEAFSGVLTTALVIGYLPALYAAFSERERKLMTLDDGSEERITPVSLLISRSPDADLDEVISFFEGWEEWVSSVIETHTTFAMLRMFRSKHPGQHWITAAGLIADTALECQIIVGLENRSPYWTLRRIIMLFNELTVGVDLSEYRARLDANYAIDGEVEDNELFQALHRQLTEHGFDVHPLRQAREETLELRRLYDAQLEYLIDSMLAPRGFWGHKIGLPMSTMLDQSAGTGEAPDTTTVDASSAG